MFHFIPPQEPDVHRHKETRTTFLQLCDHKLNQTKLGRDKESWGHGGNMHSRVQRPHLPFHHFALCCMSEKLLRTTRAENRNSPSETLCNSADPLCLILLKSVKERSAKKSPYVTHLQRLLPLGSLLAHGATISGWRCTSEWHGCSWGM